VVKREGVEACGGCWAEDLALCGHVRRVRLTWLLAGSVEAGRGRASERARCAVL